jgi:hypothetical protein
MVHAVEKGYVGRVAAEITYVKVRIDGFRANCRMRVKSIPSCRNTGSLAIEIPEGWVVGITSRGLSYWVSDGGALSNIANWRKVRETQFRNLPAAAKRDCRTLGNV